MQIPKLQLSHPPGIRGSRLFQGGVAAQNAREQCGSHRHVSRGICTSNDFSWAGHECVVDLVYWLVVLTILKKNERQWMSMEGLSHI